MLGISYQLRLLVVCYCIRNPHSIIIISARKATKKEPMEEEYDFENMKGRKNPYASKLKQQITIKVETDILEYFQSRSKETGIPCQQLINLYLRDCVVSNRKPVLTWVS